MVSVPGTYTGKGLGGGGPWPNENPCSTFLWRECSDGKKSDKQKSKILVCDNFLRYPLPRKAEQEALDTSLFTSKNFRPANFQYI